MNANLSICPSCGAMRGDEVREEVMSSVIHSTKPITIEIDEIEGVEETEISYETESADMSIEDVELVIDISEEDSRLDLQQSETGNPEDDIVSLPLFDEPREESEPEFGEMDEEFDFSELTLEDEEVSEVVSRLEVSDPLAVVEEVSVNRAAVARETTPIAPRKTDHLVREFRNKNSDEPDWKLNVRNRLRGEDSVTEPMSDRSNESTVTVLRTGTTDAIATSPAEQSEVSGEFVRNVVTGSAAPDIIKERALRRIEESRRRYGNGGAPSGGSAIGTSVSPNDQTSTPIGIDEQEIRRDPETNGLGRKTNTGEISPPGKPKVIIRTFPTPAPAPAPVTDVSANSNPEVSSVEPDNGSETAIDEVEEAPVNPQRAEVIPIPIRTDTVDEILPDDTDASEEEPHQPGLLEFDELDEEDFEDFDEEFDEDEEEIEDLAPVSQRFNAGLFDMLICAFGALLLLSPFIVTGGNLMSATGILLFVAACALTTVAYQTLSIGLRGKTFGMRIFALEVIDIEENEYPTFGQALGHSVMFVLSLICLGLGFVTMLFNPERRAFHDLVSGTLIVREY
jgi:uncharacterized RDD family membrane protein YckC